MSTGQREIAQVGGQRRGRQGGEEVIHREMKTNVPWPHEKSFNLTTTTVVKYYNHIEVAVVSCGATGHLYSELL